MKWISYIFSSMWRLWFLIVFILVFFLFMPALLFFTAVIRNHIAVAKLARYWSKFTLWGSLLFPKVEWEEKMNTKKRYIICSNHVSTLDIPLISAILPIPLQYIGKAEITKIPIFGYFYRNNSVIVNRENRKDAYGAFLKARERLNTGINICIFPEGGIPPKSIFLKKFKNGPFRLALEGEVSIIPITIHDNKRKFPQEYFKGSPGIVRVKVHAAIDPKKLKEKTIENLNNSVYNIIFEELKSHGE